MTDGAVLTVLVHGVVATLLAIGGGCCLFFGFRLLFSKKGTESKSTFSATFGSHKLSFSAGAAGTAVVFTSALWVAGSIQALPSFSQTDKGTTVATVAVEIPYQDATAVLEPAQKKLLDAVGPTLTLTKVPLTIQGHANTGNAEMDLVLAESRAEAVRSYLVETYNVPNDKISVMSYGKSPPSLGTGIETNSVVITAK